MTEDERSCFMNDFDELEGFYGELNRLTDETTVNSKRFTQQKST